jgi:glycosyltransferase involved in cell wall biosynthesis
MRALIVTPRDPPEPGRDATGTHKRLRMFIGALGRAGVQIEILHFVSETAAAAHRDNLEQLSAVQSAHWGVPLTTTLAARRARRETFWNHYVAGAFSFFEQPQFYPCSGSEQAAAVAGCLARDPDLVLVHRLAGMCPILRSRRGRQRVFLDLDEVEHKLWVRSALAPPRWPGKFLDLGQAPALLVGELAALRRANATLVCSAVDAAYLRRIGGGRKIEVVPNAVELPTIGRPAAAANTLLFIGTYKYQPNFQAAERLIGRIWPLIRARAPAARLLLAGEPPGTPELFARLPEGIEYLGFVDDLDALYARSRVVCCPLAVGGGTRMKLLEAAAYGKPMVATRLGAEGLDFVDGGEILLRDDDAGFADACLRLLADDALGARLGAAARRKVAQSYELSAVQDRIAGILLGGG